MQAGLLFSGVTVGAVATVFGARTLFKSLLASLKLRAVRAELVRRQLYLASSTNLYEQYWNKSESVNNILDVFHSWNTILRDINTDFDPRTTTFEYEHMGSGFESLVRRTMNVFSVKTYLIDCISDDRAKLFTAKVLEKVMNKAILPLQDNIISRRDILAEVAKMCKNSLQLCILLSFVSRTLGFGFKHNRHSLEIHKNPHWIIRPDNDHELWSLFEFLEEKPGKETVGALKKVSKTLEAKQLNANGEFTKYRGHSYRNPLRPILGSQVVWFDFKSGTRYAAFNQSGVPGIAQESSVRAAMRAGSVVTIRVLGTGIQVREPSAELNEICTTPAYDEITDLINGGAQKLARWYIPQVLSGKIVAGKESRAACWYRKKVDGDSGPSVMLDIDALAGAGYRLAMRSDDQIEIVEMGNVTPFQTFTGLVPVISQNERVWSTRWVEPLRTDYKFIIMPKSAGVLGVPGNQALSRQHSTRYYDP